MPAPAKADQRHRPARVRRKPSISAALADRAARRGEAPARLGCAPWRCAPAFCVRLPVPAASDIQDPPARLLFLRPPNAGGSRLGHLPSMRGPTSLWQLADAVLSPTPTHAHRHPPNPAPTQPPPASTFLAWKPRRFNYHGWVCWGISLGPLGRWDLGPSLPSARVTSWTGPWHSLQRVTEQVIITRLSLCQSPHHHSGCSHDLALALCSTSATTLFMHSFGM